MSDLAVNRRATFDYEILETFEAGLSLIGTEAKSIRAGRANLAGAFVVLRGGEAFLVNADIPPYQNANAPSGYDPARARRLLLHRRELNTLIGAAKQKGLTLVAIRLYTKGPRIKLAFGLCRRKKPHDRRERIREREDRKNISRAMRNSRG